MKAATFFEQKNRTLCNLFGRSFVSWRTCTTFATAHETATNGCAASVVRLQYSVKFLHIEDFTYLGGQLDLWAVAEATCGILTMCLPVSPKFFQSLRDAKLWFKLKNSLHSYPFMRSKNGRLVSNAEAPSDENIVAKLNIRNDPTSLKGYFKKYHYVTAHETELASVSSNDGGERTVVRDDREVQPAWTSARALFRITIMRESGAASPLNLEDEEAHLMKYRRSEMWGECCGFFFFF